MGRRPSRLALAAAILAALPVAGADAADPQSQELIVGFRAGVTAAQQERVLKQAGARAKRRFGKIRAALVTGRADVLRKDPRVRYVEQNRTVRIDADPGYTQLWGLENTGQLVGWTFGVPDADTDAPDAWSATEGGGVVVAVTDTGVDASHPDLASQMWRNADETPGNGVDDDGNGFVDDVNGWDFANGDANPTDDHGHGTHVAGTVAAARDNGVGIVGVAPGARVMPIKFLDEQGVGTLADGVSAVLYAGANGASVINASWGDTEFSQALSDAVESVNALVVASAGNSASDNDAVAHYPSGFDAPNVVSVAATDNRDQLAWFSNVGRTTVDLGAPGVAIYSTWPAGGYRYLDGTSMASPHVSGAAALALAARPGSTISAVKSLLLATVDPSAWLAGATVTGGRLNANAAVRCSGPTLVLEAPVAPLDAWVGEPIQIRARASRCGETGTVTVSAEANGAAVELASAGDGIYTGSFVPTQSGSLTISVTASAEGQIVTRVAAGSVSPTIVVALGDPPLTLSFAEGQNAKLKFTATAGKRVSINVTSVTARPATVTLRAADGTSLGSLSLWAWSTSGFLEPRELPETATYSVVIDPSGTATGSLTIALYDVPPDTETALAFGVPAPVAASVPGQNGRGTFTGTAGQRVSLKLSSSTISSGRVSILSPDGSTLAPAAYFGTGGGFVEPRSLPRDGVYTVLVDLTGTATGSVTLTLYDVPPDASAALAFGTPQALSTSVPGQNAQATFSGTAGKTVSLKLSSSTISGRVSIVSPDGSTLPPAPYFGTSGGFLEPRVLPLNGAYTIFVDPTGTATGSVTLTAYDVPPDVEGTLQFGSPVSLSVGVPGQNARASFTGTAGHRFSLVVSGIASGARVSVLAPNGSTLLAPFYVSSSGGFVEPVVLASTGTYVVVVDLQGAGTGSITLTLHDVPPDAQASLAVGGTATLTVTAPGQNAAATFDANGGQARTLRLSSVTISQTYVRITAPDGTTLVAPTYVGIYGKTITFTPNGSGVHTIHLDPQRTYTGSATLTLS